MSGFNSNIRCIEIGLPFASPLILHKFNSNIRCIEIKTNSGKYPKGVRLIVTLDVLKCQNMIWFINHLISLIVTLDVLKCHFPREVNSPVFV